MAAAAVLVAPLVVGVTAVGDAAAAPGIPPIAFHAAGGGLWTLDGGDTGIALAAGTSPAVAKVLNGNATQLAYQDAAGTLQYRGLDENQDGQPMAAGTSPAITELQPPSTPEGQYLGSRYEVAFQNRSGNLQTAGYLRSREFALGMAAGTSPAITSLENGNDGLPHWQVAFQANTGTLFTVGDITGPQDLGYGMAPGTSPSIARSGIAGWTIAFQANTGTLWVVTNGVAQNLGYGMAPGTSPSIAPVGGGGIEIAFQANTGTLWTVGNNANLDWQLGMRPGSSPSIGQLPGGGFQVAFQDTGGQLWTVGGAGNQSYPLGVDDGTRPAIASALG